MMYSNLGLSFRETLPLNLQEKWDFPPHWQGRNGTGTLPVKIVIDPVPANQLKIVDPNAGNKTNEDSVQSMGYTP